MIASYKNFVNCLFIYVIRYYYRVIVTHYVLIVKIENNLEVIIILINNTFVVLYVRYLPMIVKLSLTFFVGEFR
jgi:hypothetical protein